MQGMPFDMILTQPLAEYFTCDGKAPNVLAAHNLAWEALNSSLAGDPVGAWALKLIQHTYDPTPPGGVVFHAEFVRNPDHVEEEDERV